MNSAQQVLSLLVRDLRRQGFGTLDEPIRGVDVVATIYTHWTRLVKAAEMVDEHFADAVINGQPEQFDAIEIGGVRETVEDNGTINCEIDNVAPSFYSVYLHSKEGGVECCANVKELAGARRYAKTLSLAYGWPVHDMTGQPT